MKRNASYKFSAQWRDHSFTRSASPSKTQQWGVNVAGYITGEFGLASAVRSTIRGLEAVDMPYVLNNVITQVHRHSDTSFNNFSSTNPYPINLIHVNADLFPQFLNLVGPAYFEGRYNIGVWFWELEHFPDRWLASFAPFQEIWVKSKFSQESIAHRSLVPVVKTILPIVVDETHARPDRARFNLPEDPYIFLFNYDYLSVFERKNPLGLLSAFRQAFGNQKDVLLVLKSINSQKFPREHSLLKDAARGLNVRLIEDHLDNSDMTTLMATADCYISLHRSEGFGLGLAKSMYLGKPVIATAYSGNLDFMNIGNSFLVDYKLVELERDYGPYERGNVWAEPNTEHAAEIMRLVYEDRDNAASKGRRAAKDIRQYYNVQAAGAEMYERLRLIIGQYRNLPELVSSHLLTKAAPTLQVIQKGREGNWQVDIVVPIYGHPELIRHCVQSVLNTTENAHLILVDDCSPGYEIEDLFATWRDHPRLTLARTSSNQGFIGATQQGAKLGKAPFILFLNSDIEAINQGWLEEMIPADPDIKIVGALLLFPPQIAGPLAGKVQHAGVARNAKGIPYHPFLGWDAHTPEVQQVREVNAVTGACFLIRRTVWEELGGWDQRFGKGVYEDVDLCWRARQKGYKILYQPKAKLYHHESASKNSQGVHLLNEHLLDNLKLLINKWGMLESDEGIFFGEEIVRNWQQARRLIQKANQRLKQKDLVTATRFFQKSVTSAPTLPEALISYAQFLAQQGNHPEAAMYYERGIQILPNLWEIRLKLVDEWLQIGEIKKAMDELRNLKSVFPHHPEVLKRKIPPKEILQVILNEDDIYQSIQENRDLIDQEVIDYINIQAQQARIMGDIEMAEGFEAFVALAREA